MSDANAQNIEAQLCAYVEGELDAAQRAQIERHLQANPKDRAMLEELMRLRADVRGLPHEAAPADLADALELQLERSALLDHPPQEGGRLRRIGHWPHMAVAAMVMLAIGLALVVWAVLAHSSPTRVALAPGPTATPGVVASTQPAMPGVSVAETEPQPAAGPGVSDGEQAANRLGVSHGFYGGAAATSPAGGDSAYADNGGNKRAADMSANMAPAKEAAGQISPSPSYTLVVSTDSPSAAATKVAQFLSDNRIAYHPTVAAPTGELANAQTTVASGVDAMQGTERQPSAPAAPAKPEGGAASQADEMSRGDGGRQAGATTAPAVADRGPAASGNGVTSAAYACRMTFRQADQLAQALSGHAHERATLIAAGDGEHDFGRRQEPRSVVTGGATVEMRFDQQPAPDAAVDMVIVFENQPATVPPAAAPPANAGTDQGVVLKARAAAPTPAAPSAPAKDDDSGK